MGRRNRAAAAAACLLLAGLTIACAAGGGAAEWVSVRRVTDGDTIQLADGRRVRYIGIDAPEIDHDRDLAEPWAEAALAANWGMVAEARIRLVFDQETHDRFGRLLAYVFLEDGKLVNAELLRRGLAHVLYKRPNTGRFEQLLEAQREAMRAGRGQWSPPAADGGPVLGNRNSRRFHLYGCPSAGRIHPRNRVAFKKKWDAFWEGYSPARDCIPPDWRPRG